MTTTPDPTDELHEFVARLFPSPPEVADTDADGNPLDPERLWARRLFAQDDDE